MPARGFWGGGCSGVCVFSSGFGKVSVAIAMASFEAVEAFFLAFRGGIADFYALVYALGVR